jgi:putative hydrolase of the HAD superfamily
MGKIEAVVFDWGGVLIENPAPGIVQFCAKALGVSEDNYKRAYGICMDDFQRGLASEEQFWKNMTIRLGVSMPKVNSLWGDALAAVHVEMPGMLSIVNALRKAGLKTALLSNTEMPAVEIFKKQKNNDIFDVAVFSCIEGTKKPDSKIYEITLSRLKTPACQTLFVDDRQDFIDGAQNAGLRTILFESVQQFKKELLKLGLNIV